jgi:flagellum-specific ATP synthase
MIPVPSASFQTARQKAQLANPIRIYGKVQSVVGLVIESTGPPAKLGDLCYILPLTSQPPWGEIRQENALPAEVVGFRGNHLLLMPLGDMAGVQAGCFVANTGSCRRVPVGAQLRGRVLDALGQPMDGGPILSMEKTYPLHNFPPTPLQRSRIAQVLPTGIRAIDALLTIGKGQRIGIFSGSGVGKSTLLGMMARHSSADVNVIALVGERGREVREFLENDLGKQGLSRSVVIVATSEQPALLRISAALTATAIAEFFRDEGKNVLFMMDSVTRFAMAQREVGLAIGEPPATKGYTPSVFALLPKLMERTGNSQKGSITALYTILVEGDDTNEPIADTSRAILDGHIVLERKLANAGHFPAIDVLSSLSRLMPLLVTQEHWQSAQKIRELISAYKDVEDLVSIGAYQKGTNPLADEALSKWSRINAFLRQERDESASFQDAVAQLKEIAYA